MSAGTVLIVEPNPGILIVARNVLARAGFRVLAAHDANEGVAMARQTRPDVVLVDAKHGHPRVLDAISTASWSGIPVIMTVQRGRDAVTLESIELDNAQNTKIAEFVEKPFVPERLLAAVERVIDRWREHTEPLDRDKLMSIADVAGDAFERERTDTFPFADLLQRDHSDTEADDVTKLNPVVAPVLAERVKRLKLFFSAEGLDPDETTLRVCARAVDELGQSSMPPPPTEAGQLAVRGYIERMPVDQILQLASTVEGPSRCVLEQGETKIEIFYHGSEILFARGSRMPEGFTLGRLLVVLGRVDQRVVDRTLESKKNGGFLGQRLIEAGVLDQKDLTGALQRQTEELIYEAISWKTGVFEVHAKTLVPREAAEAGLSLPVHHILLEGMRRLDEWQRMMGAVGDLGTVLSRVEISAPSIVDKLRPEERRLLEHIDGRRTIRELILSARRPTFHAFRTLYSLAGQRLIVRATA